MQFTLPKLNISSQTFLKTCGYIKIENPHKDNEISYARSFDPGRFYPRFHAYINELPNKTMEINLHLDMKKPSYEGSSAHSGEYDGELIENEIQRIKDIAEKFLLKINASEPLGFQNKKPWWKFW